MLWFGVSVVKFVGIGLFEIVVINWCGCFILGRVCCCLLLRFGIGMKFFLNGLFLKLVLLNVCVGFSGMWLKGWVVDGKLLRLNL